MDRLHKLLFRSLIILLVMAANYSIILSDNINDSDEDSGLIFSNIFNKHQNILLDSFFVCKELLSRPTDRTMTVHLLPAIDMVLFIEYGTDSANFTDRTTDMPLKKDSSYSLSIENLNPDTDYFYRINFKPNTLNDFIRGNINRFHTQRLRGRTFTFDLEADPHLDSNSIPDAYALTLKNIINDKPDFMIDLGDNFMCEKLPDKSQQNITGRHLLLRSYFEQTCHSVPLFLILGNHEGEWGSLTDANYVNLSVMASNTRKHYFANPEPNTFYTGNSKSENKVGLRQNYYSWEWGNALFVVLDPYWYTNPKTGWGMTLGSDQYHWLENTLKSSTAKFKFVFCHNLVGGADKDMRGGVEAAGFYEWGGRDTNNTWTFDKNRPGWNKPIHQLMVDYGVNIFFHGHDHFYGYQQKDGIIYQEVPQPSNRNLANTSAASYGYKSGTILPGRGYLRITVSDTVAKVEYVNTRLPNEENGQIKNGFVAHSYVVTPKTTFVNDNLNSHERFNVYPNPTNGQIYFEGYTENCAEASVQVYELVSGDLVKSFNNIKIDYDHFKFSWENDKTLINGEYLCTFKSCNSINTFKLIIK